MEEFVPTELLPTEYGGKAGDIKTIKADLMDKLVQHRCVEWFFF